MNHSTYEKFTAMNQEMHEEMMALTRDAYQWVLTVAAIVEEQIERMNCSTSH